MKAKTWLLSGVLAATMAGAVGGASAQTYVYGIEGVPSPTGANNAALFMRARGREDVTATVYAYNAAGELGDDERDVTVPGKGFIRLNRDDLALGHDTGGRSIEIRADGELNVSAMRMIWGSPAVSLTVSHWLSSEAMPDSHVPPVPVNLAAAANTKETDGRIDLTWDAVDVSAVDWGVTYSIGYRTEGEEWTVNDVGNVVERTINVVAGNTYDIRIRANRSDGAASSDWSEHVSVQARNRPPGAFPVRRVHIDRDPKVISFSENSSERATSYELQYRRGVAGSNWNSITEFGRRHGGGSSCGVGEGYNRSPCFDYSNLAPGAYQGRLRGIRPFAEPGAWSDAFTWGVTR